ncbi:MAG: DUF2520 domain-containing protein [Coriobacteriales bacterium]|jgi:predicted short-subunit dehydrogenase-like oxidoreductase (DUF2520 family)|nr:DUF2520 domain-containing protein [Coriobacteriales bacterium]
MDTKAARSTGLAPRPIIGFVGAGRVGKALGRHLSERGLKVSGYYRRNQQASPSQADGSTRQEALDVAQEGQHSHAKTETPTHALTDSTQALPGTSWTSLAELADQCDILFLTVPDDAITTVWNELRGLTIAGKAICHCSGIHSTAVFEGIEATGATGFSLHPLCAVTDDLASMSGVYFTLEGSCTHPAMERLIAEIDNPVQIIAAEDKSRYHAAAVFVSNFVNGLSFVGSKLLEDSGLDEEFAHEAWRGLFLGNARAIAEKGPAAALTGPVERGDLGTVRAHLEALEAAEASTTPTASHPSAATLYKLLSSTLVELAEVKNPHRDYSPMKEMLTP